MSQLLDNLVGTTFRGATKSNLDQRCKQHLSSAPATVVCGIQGFGQPGLVGLLFVFPICKMNPAAECIPHPLPLISGLSLQVSCLCGSAPCLLCGCCPSAKNSTISRLLFTFFLFLGTLVSIIMIIPGVEKELHKVMLLPSGRWLDLIKGVNSGWVHIRE